MPNQSVSTAFLDDLYAKKPDPWDLATSSYEADKYAATIAALPRLQYDRGVEIGCAIGVLTARLAEKCRQLVAIDPAAAALRQARARNATADNVIFEQATLPGDGLDGRFDLIVLSEVLYFMSIADVQETADLVLRHATAEADLILVNWRPASDLPLTGDAAATAFMDASGSRARILFQARNDRYRLDVLRTTAP